MELNMRGLHYNSEGYPQARFHGSGESSASKPMQKRSLTIWKRSLI